MAESSRKGKKIARRACDLCRDRRVQCVFDEDTSSACRQCERSNAACTFLTGRKPRGPPSRRVAEARQRALDRTEALGPNQLPLGPVTVAHFVPEPIFLAILDDFLERVYPVLPLVHVPTFTANLRSREFETDPAFFRLCMCLCAVTVASIPRNVAACYGSTWYRDSAEMVERASRIVLLSRLATTPGWQNYATVDSMVVSVVLAMASHYAGKPNAGWAYASEAIHFFRELELYKEEAYRGFNPIERELCKRSFWLLLIIQIHDRMSFTIPHTGLSYDPQQTDWEYLLPLQLSDEELAAESRGQPVQPSSTPIIAGFIALIKVFLCLVDLLDKSFPGPPPYFSLSPGALASTLLPDQDGQGVSPQTSSKMPLLESLFHVMTRLDATLRDLPEPLSLPGRIATSPEGLEEQQRNMAQFDIMRANIHITAIYFQSLILEMCLNQVQNANTAASPEEMETTSPGSSINTQLWQMKESVARELLDILSCSSAAVLESNGSSMIKKIREIAATFLDQDAESPHNAERRTIEGRSRQYLGRFVQILTELDYVPESS